MNHSLLGLRVLLVTGVTCNLLIWKRIHKEMGKERGVAEETGRRSEWPDPRKKMPISNGKFDSTGYWLQRVLHSYTRSSHKQAHYTRTQTISKPIKLYNIN